LSEQENKSRFGLGSGITITTGFDVSTRLPLDARTVAQDLEALTNIPDAFKYEGLLVFVVEENKLYQWKRELLKSGSLSQEYSWGPIESEISAQELLDLSEIDFNATPIYYMQKNKETFFPLTHESAIFVDKDGKKLADKYQPIYDEKLNTKDKTLAGSVNEVYTKMEDTIEEFRDEMKATLDGLKKDVGQMKEDTTKDFDIMKDEMQDKIDKINQDFADQINQMLNDIDNSILSDLDVTNLMRQIQENLTAIEEFEEE
jgi:hypothetical protein